MKISKTKTLEVFKKNNGNCWYCGCCNANTVDHVVPKSNSGSDDIENLVPACKKCNSQKNKKTLEQFRFYCSWSKTNYSKVISSMDAHRLIEIGVNFNGFKNDHKFSHEIKAGSSI